MVKNYYDQCFNSDLNLPNGTGSVNIIGNTINLSNLSSGIIENDTTGALTISATDEGYHKIGGTFGVRVPTGNNSNRGSGNQVGDTRYNNTGGGFLETWDGSVWQVSQVVVVKLYPKRKWKIPFRIYQH